MIENTNSATAAAILMVVLASFAGCKSRQVTHLIPDGYVGPVVIVFEDARGVEIKQDGDGGIVYEIPGGGVLRQNTSLPEAGWRHVHYFYVGLDGARREIPRDVDRSEFQVFGMQDGASYPSVNEKPIRWIVYLLGVPNERRDWDQVRSEAIARACGIPFIRRPPVGQ